MRPWPKGDQPEFWWIKSVDADRVVLDLHRPQVAIISAESFEWRELGYFERTVPLDRAPANDRYSRFHPVVSLEITEGDKFGASSA